MRNSTVELEHSKAVTAPMLKRLQKELYGSLSGIETLAADEKCSFKLLLKSLEIGTLRAENGEWVFEYSNEFRQQKEIKPIVNFPVLDRKYRSRVLWPFFALRIPSPEQGAVREFIHSQPDRNADEAICSRSLANAASLIRFGWFRLNHPENCGR